MRVVFAMLLIVSLAGCTESPDEPVQELGETEMDDSTPAMEQTNSTVNETTELDTFFLLMKLPNGTGDIEPGAAVDVTLESDLPVEAAANATWTVRLLLNGNETNATEGFGLAAVVQFTLDQLGNYTAVGEATAPGYEAANATVQMPSVVEVQLDPTEASVVLADESFSGSLPADGATQGGHTVQVPEGGVYIRFTYTSDYVGMFPAVARLFDAHDNEVYYTLNDCDAPFLTEPVGPWTCVMEDAYEAPAGEWEMRVYYQAGQVIEDYTVRLEVYGF